MTTETPEQIATRLVRFAGAFDRDDIVTIRVSDLLTLNDLVARVRELEAQVKGAHAELGWDNS